MATIKAVSSKAGIGTAINYEVKGYVQDTALAVLDCKEETTSSIVYD